MIDKLICRLRLLWEEGDQFFFLFGNRIWERCGGDEVGEKEKKERGMCLIGHVSNFDWGNGQNGGKEMEVSFFLSFYDSTNF